MVALSSPAEARIVLIFFPNHLLIYLTNTQHYAELVGERSEQDNLVAELRKLINYWRKEILNIYVYLN